MAGLGNTIAWGNTNTVTIGNAVGPRMYLESDVRFTINPECKIYFGHYYLPTNNGDGYCIKDLVDSLQNVIVANDKLTVANDKLAELVSTLQKRIEVCEQMIDEIECRPPGIGGKFFQEVKLSYTQLTNTQQTNTQTNDNTQTTNTQSTNTQ